LATENLTRRRIAVDGLCGNAAPASPDAKVLMQKS
jgi:hypothetical protein